MSAVNTKKHVKKLIKQVKEYINMDIDIIKKNDIETEILFGTAVYTIMPHTTFLDIKRYVDGLNEKGACGICEDALKKVGCNRCGIRTCIKCYYKLIIKNKGLYVCPYCQYQYGHLFNDEEMFFAMINLANLE
jgi:hypothetical protein